MQPARRVEAQTPGQPLRLPPPPEVRPPVVQPPAVQYPTVGSDDGWLDHSSVTEHARQSSIDEPEIAPNKRARSRRVPTESTRKSPFAAGAVAGLLRSRRVKLGAATAALVVVITIVITRATTGGKHDAPASSPAVVSNEPAPSSPPATVAATPPTAAVEEPSAPAPTKSATPPTVAPIAAKVAPRKTLGGKPLVLEDDAPKHETKKTVAVAAPVEEEAGLVRARAAYASGNQRLFSGDATGAIAAYQQALGMYPGYVAGYRGLGLAYAQQGNKLKALMALRTYVTAVPNARDVPLIKKRIARLQAP